MSTGVWPCEWHGVYGARSLWEPVREDRHVQTEPLLSRELRTAPEAPPLLPGWLLWKPEQV